MQAQNSGATGTVMAARHRVEPGGGDVVMGLPLGVVTKVRGAQTGGLLAIVEHAIAPGVMAPPHMHRDLDEWSYVLEGEVGARIGDEEFTAGPGGYILKPRGIRHTFWNAGPAPARIIEMITPAGFERFFESLAELLATGSFTPERLGQLAAEHGTSYFHDWTAELEARYGVKVVG